MIKEKLLEIFYNFLLLLTNIWNIIEELNENVSKQIISNGLNNSIYEIKYLNHNRDILELIYKKSIYEVIYTMIYSMINEKHERFEIDNEIRKNLEEYIDVYEEGYIKLRFYENNVSNEILINMKFFRNNLLMIKNKEFIIKNVILNFIDNKVLLDDKDIIHVEINNVKMNKSLEITKTFMRFKNSFKLNNISGEDMINLLNYELCNNMGLKELRREDYNIITTDKDLEEIKYELKDYIDYKTIYEEKMENKNKI